jgi:hypothetical protein
MEWRKNVRKREVAEQYLDDKDYCQRKHLPRDLQVKLEQTAARDAARAV